jgi:hypothetical protein
MNTEQLTSYFQALIASVTVGVIIPMVILFAMMFFIWRMLTTAQRNHEFRIHEIFCDEERKASAARFIMLMAFGYSCYYLTTRLLAGNPDRTEFFAFLAAWSSSLTLLKLAEKWDGQLPFTKKPDGS